MKDKVFFAMMAILVVVGLFLVFPTKDEYGSRTTAEYRQIVREGKEACGD